MHAENVPDDSEQITVMGAAVGLFVGAAVGAFIGAFVGASVGALVGLSVSLVPNMCCVNPIKHMTPNPIIPTLIDLFV